MSNDEIQQEIKKIESAKSDSLTVLQIAFIDSCINILSHLYNNKIKSITMEDFTKLCEYPELSMFVEREFRDKEIGYFNIGFNKSFSIEQQACMKAMCYYIGLEGDA